MQFKKTREQNGSTALKQRLVAELAADKHVLWLLSGGSNIAISVAIMQTIPEEITKKLVIMLIDERYGEVGHQNSNAKQLHEAGLEPKDAVFVPTLVPSLSLNETRERYSEVCGHAFEHADVVIAQIGMGADGHIAGILPHTSAVDATGWTTSYDTPTFKRLTLTFEALQKVSVAYVFAYGAKKAPALQQLHDDALSLAEQPAQFLKQLPEAYVFNDQIGDTT